MRLASLALPVLNRSLLNTVHIKASRAYANHLFHQFLFLRNWGILASSKRRLY